MTPLQFRNLPLSACTHWETSLWFASAASWHGASAVTCPRHSPHMSSFYEGRNIIKEIQPAYESLIVWQGTSSGLSCYCARFLDLGQPPSGFLLSINLWHTCLLVWTEELITSVNATQSGINVWRIACKCHVLTFVLPGCWEEQQKRHNFHTESSGDLPDLNLLRISMECSEPRRVIMLTIEVQCLRGTKWSHSICGVHFDPPGQLWMKMKCSSLLHQVL